MYGHDETGRSDIEQASVFWPRLCKRSVGASNVAMQIATICEFLATAESDTNIEVS